MVIQVFDSSYSVFYYYSLLIIQRIGNLISSVPQSWYRILRNISHPFPYYKKQRKVVIPILLYLIFLPMELTSSICCSILLTAILASLITNSSAYTNVATPNEIHTSNKYKVHSIWPNGPTHTGKIGGNWPNFSDKPTVVYSESDQCYPGSLQYTGYTNSGEHYCQDSSNDLDEIPELLIYSEKLGIVVDANGATSSGGTLIKSLGVSNPPDSIRGVYENLPEAKLDVTLTKTCSDETDVYALTGLEGSHSQFGLVRQGHTMTHIIATGLVWKDESNENQFLCSASIYKNPDNANCNQDYGAAGAYACTSEEYPLCKNFVQGKAWGKCWGDPNCSEKLGDFWVEINVWGDSIAVEVRWALGITIADVFPGCTLEVSSSLASGGVVLGEKSLDLTSELATLAFLVLEDGSGSVVLKVDDAQEFVTVSSTGSAAGVVLSRPTLGDFAVEVPTNLKKCRYSPCGKLDTWSYTPCIMHSSTSQYHLVYNILYSTIIY